MIGFAAFVATFGNLLLNLFAAESPPPGPTARPSALDALVGVWDIRATCRFSPHGEPFEGKGVEYVYWSENRQFLISDEWVLLPAGWLPKIVVTSWDPLSKQYRVTNVLPNATFVTKMTLEGKITTTLEETDKDRQTIRTWTTTEQVSPEEKRFRSECSVDGGIRWLLTEGTSIKRANPVSDRAAQDRSH